MSISAGKTGNVQGMRGVDTGISEKSGVEVSIVTGEEDATLAEVATARIINTKANFCLCSRGWGCSGGRDSTTDATKECNAV